MDIISKNSKTGFSLNFPIEHTCDKSCPFYQNRSCYGLKGRFLFRNVREANETRLAIYRKYPATYFEMLSKELDRLSRRGIRYIRVNGIGDTPDMKWAEMFAATVAKYPEMRFWVATRKKYIWSSVGLPCNVTVRYSDGIEGATTSSVVDDPKKSSCPATVGLVKDCKECGYHCWLKDVKHVAYAKH